MKSNLGVRIFGVVVLIAVLIAAIFIGGGEYGLGAFIDFPSVLIVVIIPLSMLMLAGQVTDYLRAIQIAGGRSDFTLKEFKSSSIAIGLTIRMIYMSGVIGTLVGVMQILIYLSDPANIFPALSVSLLTLFYALFFNSLHYAIKAKIDKEIVYRES